MNSILWTLWTVFWQIGFFSIGGGYAIIPLIQEQVVNQFGWVSEKVFTDVITLSQMTPGPLAVNTSTFVGIQIAGIPGAIVATLGCIISGVTISIVLFHFFQKYQNSPYVFEVFQGLRAASTGLILSASATILLIAFFGASALPLMQAIDFYAIALFLLSLLILRKWKWNPIGLMLATGFCGLWIYGDLL